MTEQIYLDRRDDFLAVMARVVAGESPKGTIFNMQCWAKAYACMTHACAMGHYCLMSEMAKEAGLALFGGTEEDDGNYGITFEGEQISNWSVAAYFGIDEWTSDYLFCSSDGYDVDGELALITPEMVLDKARKVFAALEN